ncbi:MAG TPA: hypothetical protein VMZ66_09025 [Aeromicrobium sp.]|nr:hypothetical protein [Aeromicrobium sp.]
MAIVRGVLTFVAQEALLDRTVLAKDGAPAPIGDAFTELSARFDDRASVDVDGHDDHIGQLPVLSYTSVMPAALEMAGTALSGQPPLEATLRDLSSKATPSSVGVAVEVIEVEVLVASSAKKRKAASFNRRGKVSRKKTPRTRAGTNPAKKAGTKAAGSKADGRRSKPKTTKGPKRTTQVSKKTASKVKKTTGKRTVKG